MVTLYSCILDAKGQPTLWFVVGCGGKSNSFKLLWLSLLPTKKRKALELSQLYPSIFKTLKGSELHDRLWNLAKNKTHSSFYGELQE